MLDVPRWSIDLSRTTCHAPSRTTCHAPATCHAPRSLPHLVPFRQVLTVGDSTHATCGPCPEPSCHPIQAFTHKIRMECHACTAQVVRNDEFACIRIRTSGTASSRWQRAATDHLPFGTPKTSCSLHTWQCNVLMHDAERRGLDAWTSTVLRHSQDQSCAVEDGELHQSPRLSAWCLVFPQRWPAPAALAPSPPPRAPPACEPGAGQSASCRPLPPPLMPGFCGPPARCAGRLLPRQGAVPSPRSSSRVGRQS